jgi:hypothetical protein
MIITTAPFVDPRFGSSVEDIAEIVNCVKTLRQIMANVDDPQYRGREMEPSASAVTDQELTHVSNLGYHSLSLLPFPSLLSPYRN